MESGAGATRRSKTVAHMLNLTINNTPVQAEQGSKLLRVIEDAGVKVPTLCEHKALTPYGACRLCVVEVHAPGRAPTVQAACSYPAQDGLTVLTHTDRVNRARRIVAELLLARCPDAEPVRRIAWDLGVREPRIRKKNDDCIYCGLCVRMCRERMGRTAIGFSGRGPRKKLEPPFGKHNPVCWTCGACDFICPTGKKVSSLTTAHEAIPILNPYNFGLDSRPAVSILYPQAVPNKASIDPAYCVRLNHDDCGICQEVCQADAIDYGQKERTVELNVGAILLAPGYELYDARLKKELGYGRFPNVVTAVEFERILSASGPFSGHVLRPRDKQEPKRIAFLQCVGSRDVDHDYCSSICCMYATKEAIIAREHLGEHLQCDIFFMDLRAFSKGFEQYYQRAKELGINYIRCRVPIVEEVAGSRNLVLKYLAENDCKVSREYDMVVLSVGMQPPKDAKALAERFGVSLNDFGFCKTSVFRPTESSRPGVFAAGPFAEPKDIPETVMQASAAASQVLAQLKDAAGTLMTPRVFPPERGIAGEEPRVGVFVCHCGSNIAGYVNVPAVVEYARTLPNVAYAENNLYTCSNDTQERIKQQIAEHRLNRVVVASCTPRTHEPLFRNTLREAGLNPYLFEMANIRDQCSWVHMYEPDAATEKSKDLVRMAVAKARMLEPLQKRSIPVRKSGLVIGGGLSGMTAALALAGEGFEAHLVEKEEELGGNLRHIHYLMNGEDPQHELKALRQRIRENRRIHVHVGALIENIEGSIGHFTTRLSAAGETVEITHGAVIVATGAREHATTGFAYGQHPGVMTQRELEQHLAADSGLLATAPKQPAKTVVMIQCVGSRDAEHPYCSRICCAEAIKNALRIKQLAPQTHVYVLYRDIRTYGFKESYYTKARQQGVMFLRYDESAKPEVTRYSHGLMVTAVDQTLGVPVRIDADLVVLSAGIQADVEENRRIAQFLKVPLNADGFFLEAHMKLRPVDFMTDGVFLCGLAHSPKSIEESILQAQAAAARAATVLSQDNIDLEANISRVVDQSCDGCAYCVDTCPFKGITLLEYMWQGSVKKVVEANESVCKGCGCCQATCPKNGIVIGGFTLEQIKAQIDAALGVA